MLHPEVVKVGLILAQINAESERSLTVNARIVTKECDLGETITVGLRAVKEAVRFYKPQLCGQEMYLNLRYESGREICPYNVLEMN